MNKLTLLALIGATSAHPHFYRMWKRHAHHHGKQHDHKGPREHHEPTMYTPYDFLPIKGKVPDAPVECEFEEGDILPDLEFWRTVIGESYKSWVKGWYNTAEDKIGDECFGEWMDPMIEFQKGFWHQIRHDPMSTSIEDAHTAANNFVDLHWRNRDSCHIGMIKDDYYNWCLDNEDVCLGQDNQFWTRLYENGYTIFGHLYDLAGIVFFENDECYTDFEMIEEHNRVVTDIASLMSYIMGFNLTYDPSRVEEHYTFREFRHGVRDYFVEMYHEAQQAIQFQEDSQKDYFGADGHSMWNLPVFPTPDETQA